MAIADLAAFEDDKRPDKPPQRSLTNYTGGNYEKRDSTYLDSSSAADRLQRLIRIGGNAGKY